MQVRDAMTRGVMVTGVGEKVRTVVEKMIQRRCGSIPVVDGDQNLVGIVAIRDIILPLYPNCESYIHDELHGHYFQDMEDDYPEVLKMSVREVMTSSPIALAPEDPILKAASLMGVRNLRRMPVCAGRRLVGMISIGDINRALFMAYVESLAPESKASAVNA